VAAGDDHRQHAVVQPPQLRDLERLAAGLLEQRAYSLILRTQIEL
jgi:hypothetical protein